MASKRRLRRKACGNKVKFSERHHAEAAMRSCLRAGKTRGGKVRVYHCRHCQQFHWGHYSVSSC